MVYRIISAKRRLFLQKCHASLPKEGASQYSSKVSGSRVDMTLLSRPRVVISFSLTTPTPPASRQIPRPSHPRELDFGPFRVHFGSFRLRLGPFRVCFGSVWGLFGVLGGVGERGFCKGKEYHYPRVPNGMCNIFVDNGTADQESTTVLVRAAGAHGDHTKLLALQFFLRLV